MPLLAPYVNSYRRLMPDSDAPINVHWGVDNRTVGFRVPISSPDARRVENRVAGAAANPYLAMADSLACGYLGVLEALEASKTTEGSAYQLAVNLPRPLADPSLRLNRAPSLAAHPGHRTVHLLTTAKGTG